jgi:hypothetical protein
MATQEKKPRTSGGFWNGKVKHNLDGLTEQENAELIKLAGKSFTKPADKTLWLLEKAGIKADTLRVEEKPQITATPEEQRLEKNVSVVKAFVSQIESKQKARATDKQYLEIIQKCPDKLMQEALIKKFCLVIPKPEEFSFV